MRRGIGPRRDYCSQEPQPASSEREEERVPLEHGALISTRRRRVRLTLGVVLITIFVAIFLLHFLPHRISLFFSTPNVEETRAPVVFKLYRKIKEAHGESEPRMGNRIGRLPLDIKKTPLRTSQSFSWNLRGGRHKGKYVDNYYIKMAMGVPPKVFHLDIDTGSPLTWVQSDYINGSIRLADWDLFKINRGAILDCRLPICSQYQIFREECESRSNYWCFMTVAYLDNSQFEGVIAKDMITLNFGDGSIILNFDGNEDPFPVPVVFGCSYESHGDVKIDNPGKSPTDGLMGLSSSKITISAQLKAGGVIDNNVVGICMATDDEIDDDASGYLFFGNAISTRELQWTNMKFFATERWGTIITCRFEGAFMLLANVWYGEEEISCQQDVEEEDLKMIFDTGRKQLRDDAVKSGYIELIPQAESPVPGDPADLPDLCWTHADPAKIRQGSQGVSMDFKSIVFLFEGGEKFSMHPQQYFATPGAGSKCICLTIFPDTGNQNTLGALAMKGKLFVFDYDSRRVGWETSTCKISNLLLRTTRKERRYLN